MKPVKFKEVNATMMPEEYQSLIKAHPKEREDGKLPICVLSDGWLSCWKLSFADRIRAVIFGRVWIYNFSPKYHYPISMECMRNIFVKLKTHKKKEEL